MAPIFRVQLAALVLAFSGGKKADFGRDPANPKARLFMVPVSAAKQAVEEVPAFGPFGNNEEIVKRDVEVDKKLREMAKSYSDARKRRQQIGAKMVPLLAEFKAIKVGRGQSGEWRPFVEGKLGLALSTVDRWIEKGLAGAEIPNWVREKLLSNKPTQTTGKGRTHKVTMTFVLETADEQRELSNAAKTLGKKKLTKLLLDAVRGELGVSQ
jgi:hypothetical protein